MTKIKIFIAYAKDTYCPTQQRFEVLDATQKIKILFLKDNRQFSNKLEFM